MRTLPDASVDMVFADPPYNLQLASDLHRPDESKVSGVTENWDKFADFQKYDSFTHEWLSEARRVMQDHATIWVMGSYHNIFRVGRIMQDLGFWILNDVIWIKHNPMPNFHGTRLTNAHETLIWAAKSSDSQYRFNYHSLKVMNDDLQARSDWYFPICAGKERLRDGLGKKVHPTQKPLALLKQVILTASEPGDTILDPFLGTGTTATAAKTLGRNSIGIEQDRTYLQHARQRLDETPEGLAETVHPMVSPRKMPRVPFGSVLSSGLIKDGDTLVSACSEKFHAIVHADASISYGDVRGSIHRVGALLQNRESCNGWTYWNTADGQSIDVLRQHLIPDRRPTRVLATRVPVGRRTAKSGTKKTRTKASGTQ